MPNQSKYMSQPLPISDYSDVEVYTQKRTVQEEAEHELSLAENEAELAQLRVKTAQEKVDETPVDLFDADLCVKSRGLRLSRWLTPIAFLI